MSANNTKSGGQVPRGGHSLELALKNPIGRPPFFFDGRPLLFSTGGSMSDTVFLFDIETSSADVHSEFKCMAWRDGIEAPICYTDDPTKACNQITYAVKMGWPLCGHNVMTFDLPVLLYNMDRRTLMSMPLHLKEWGAARVWDTLIWSVKLDPSRRSHSMDSYAAVLAESYGAAPKTEVEDWGEAPPELLKERCMNDVEIQTCLLKWFVEGGAPDSVPNYNIDMDFLPVVLSLMVSGIPFDRDEAGGTLKRLTARTTGPALLAETLAPGVNFRSNKQIDEYCRREYGEGLPLTEKGRPSFNKDNQLELARKFPILDYVVRTRKDVNLLKFLDPEQENNFGNFLAPSPAFGGAEAIYPSFRLYGTRTMRSQYSKPAISQFPTAIRRTVRAPEGFFFVGFDIVALEMAVIGYLFKTILDDNYIFDQMESGVSVKQLTLDAFEPAMKNTNYREGETPESVAKTVNYSILFGIASETLAKRLNCYDGRKPNEALIDECIERRFPGFRRLSDLIKSTVKGDTVRTIYGTQVVTEERKAFNTVVQSSGAEYCRLVGSLLTEETRRNLDAFPWVWMHDEFQFAVPEDRRTDELELEVAAIGAFVETRLRKEPKVGFLTGVEGKIGKTWYSTH